MIGHTPGPWEVNTTGLGSIWIGGNELGDTGFQTEIASVCSEYGEVSRANARLIAAAPRLLKIVTMLLKVIPDGQTYPGIDEDDPEAEIELHYEASRALAKAGWRS